MTGCPEVRWERFNDRGYEVSSAGDLHFSALFAEMPDGRSIEMHYQCDVKGFNPGGTNWRAFKGRASDVSTADRYAGFLALWAAWALRHPGLMANLDRRVGLHGDVLTDKFARSEVNQARALAELLNAKRLREWQML